MSKIQLPVVVTPTRVELGLRCYRRHVIADLLQRARYKSASLEFGSVVHAGAAAWWLNAARPRSEAVAAAHHAVSLEWNRRFEQQPEISQKDVSLDLAIAMIEGYVQQAVAQGPFALEAGDWQIVTVEDRLEVPLRLPNGSTAKLSFQQDRVVYNKSNAHLVIVDSKTAARMDARWERQWETSLQMKLYKAGSAKAYDFEVDQVDVVVEGILKDVPTRVKYVPCPEWSQGLLDEAVRQAVSIAARDNDLLTSSALDTTEVENKAVNETPLNYMSCYEYGVECPFRRLCTAEPEERVAILHAEYFEIAEADSGY